MRDASWAVSRSTSWARLLPDFLLIGGQRCGTSSLYSYLLRHPAVGGYLRKEIHYFDANYAKGHGWYRSHFPLATFPRYVHTRFGLEAVIGEATPAYMFHPQGATRVRALNPDMKLIAILRDPVDRAVSHYHLERALGVETLSLREAFEGEDERLMGERERMLADPAYWSYRRHHFSYLARGRYCEQLERWLDLFPREQVLILCSEDLFADPEGATAETLRFLDLPAHEPSTYPVLNRRDYGRIDAETERYLRSYFAQANEDLYKLLGRDLGWPGPTTVEPGRRAS